MTTQALQPARVYLLDAHGLVFQMFHGMPQMNAPDGRPTNAVFGVTRAIMDLYDQGADYLIAVFDCPEPTFREDIYPQYKAQRPPPPDDLVTQEPLIHQVLEAMRIPILRLPGYEADDILATVATAAAELGHQVFLCTSDKDCRQLLSDRIQIQNLRKGVILDAAGLMDDWGIRPNQVIDFQALVGDSVDNIPGVPGCGPKTASKWLKEYDTLDNVVAHADQLGGPKLREALKTAIETGMLEKCRTLVRLLTNVPIPMEWDNWQRRDWNGQKLLELFQEFGFRGFANKVRTTLTTSGTSKNADLLEVVEGTKDTPTLGEDKPIRRPRPDQPSLFDAIDDSIDTSFDFGANTTPDEDWQAKYQLVNTPGLFAEFIAELRQQQRFAFDLETTHLEPMRAEIVGLAFAWSSDQGYYLPIRGPEQDAVLPAKDTLQALAPIFADPKIAKVNQNIKYDSLVLRHSGVTLRGIAGDPMIAHYLLHSTDRSHNLDDLTLRYFNHKNIPITELIGTGKKQITIDQVPTTKVAEYAGEDAVAAWRLTEMFEPELTQLGLKTLYDELEIPLIDVLSEMEYHGVCIDSNFLNQVSQEMEGQLAILETESHELVGRKFNLSSPKQLREILFDDLKLPVQKRTGRTNEPSTDQESLEKLAALGHELPKKLIEHRQVAKLKGTYVDVLPALVNSRTQRLHGSFNQTIASTGRLSSSDPNLQNIPTRTEQGQQIRQAFIAAPGNQILTADYSQIELRFLAHFSEDDHLIRAFQEDHDIHTIVAAQIFKVSESEVTSAQRRVAKTVNFGVIYGMSATGLAERLTITRKEADQFIQAYFAQFPKVLDYQDQVLQKARSVGFVTTILGRRRPFDLSAIRANSTYQQRNQAEREAINMEIQGSAADLMKKAMLHVYQYLQQISSPIQMILSVHDEIVLEVPKQVVGSFAQELRQIMVSAMQLKVPLKVDVSSGNNWLQTDVEY